MKRLNKTMLAKQAELASRLHALNEATEAIVVEYNEALETAFAVYECAIIDAEGDATAAYDLVDTSAIEDAQEFAQEIIGAQDDYYDNRSEKWQEGDRGQAYDEWRTEWDQSTEGLRDYEWEIPDPDLEPPEPMEVEPIEVGGFEWATSEPEEV